MIVIAYLQNDFEFLQFCATLMMTAILMLSKRLVTGIMVTLFFLLIPYFY